MPQEIKWQENQETPEAIEDKIIEITTTKATVSSTTIRRKQNEVEIAKERLRNANKDLENVTAELAGLKTALEIA